MTMVEVIVAVLVSSFMVTSLVSVALTARIDDARSERKILAVVGLREVSSMLANFVTADTGVATIRGPGGGPGGWSMTSGPIIDHFGGVGGCGAPRNDYALAIGDHCLTGVLETFEAPPYNARVVYRVNNAEIVNGSPLPAVTLTIAWTEP